MRPWLLLVALALFAETSSASGRLFDGEEKTFAFVGYSTSYRWPNILELKMNRQFEDEIVYHLMNAAAGGAPVGTWIADPSTEDWQRSYGRMLLDWFLPLPSRPEMKGNRSSGISRGRRLRSALWYEHLLRYDRGELEQSLDSAWGPGWRESVYLKENPTDR